MQEENKDLVQAESVSSCHQPGREPSEAEVDAAAKAMCVARKPNHPSLHDDEQYWRLSGSQDLYRKAARAALRAAAEVRERAAVKVFAPGSRASSGQWIEPDYGEDVLGEKAK